MQLFFMNQAPASVETQGDEIYLGHDPQDCSYYYILVFSLILLPLQTEQSVPRTGAAQRCREEQV